jgi:hypothetical protein
LPEHLTSQRVPELMSPFAGSINARSRQGVSHQGAYPGRTFKTSHGRFHPEKHKPAAGGWPPMPQIISDCRTDIGR